MRPVELLLGNLHICAPALGQVAAVAAFGPQARAELDEAKRKEYDEARNLMASGAFRGFGGGAGPGTGGGTGGFDMSDLFRNASQGGADGGLGGYAYGTAIKQELLRREAR